jgi:hypothetical protein
MDDDNNFSLELNWTKIVVAFITASITLVGTLTTVYLKYKLRNEDKKDPVVSALERSQVLSKRMVKVRDSVDASRVTVAQFHNGTTFASGQKYDKISITHQVVAPGVSRTKSEIRGLPITLFEDALLETQQTGRKFYQQPGEIPNVGNIFADEGVRSVYIFKLESVDERFAGVIFVEFVGRTVQLSQQEIEYLDRQAVAIGSYLSSENLTQFQSND